MLDTIVTGMDYLGKTTKWLNDTTQGFLINVNGIVGNLVTPEDQFGYGGFMFDVVDEEQIKLESDITDHYVEDNIAVQDDIALKPIEVVAKGFVGEYVYETPVVESVKETISGKLALVSQYLPKMSNFAQKAMQKAQKTSDLFDTAQRKISSLYKTFNDIGQISDNKQAKAYAYFVSAWQSRQLFKIQTPYCFYDNMAIKMIKFIQTGETKDKSQIEITFKQIRKTVTTQVASAQGRLKAQISNRVNAGLIKGKETILKAIKGWGV